jgi:hypothetical protein
VLRQKGNAASASLSRLRGPGQVFHRPASPYPSSGRDPCLRRDVPSRDRDRPSNGRGPPGGDPHSLAFCDSDELSRRLIEGYLPRPVMSALGTKRTFGLTRQMPATDLKQTSALKPRLAAFDRGRALPSYKVGRKLA